MTREEALERRRARNKATGEWDGKDASEPRERELTFRFVLWFWVCVRGGVALESRVKAKNHVTNLEKENESLRKQLAAARNE